MSYINLNEDAFTNRADAIKRAEEMRNKAIKNTQKRLDKLIAMKFE